MGPPETSELYSLFGQLGLPGVRGPQVERPRNVEVQGFWALNPIPRSVLTQKSIFLLLAVNPRVGCAGGGAEAEGLLLECYVPMDN